MTTGRLDVTQDSDPNFGGQPAPHRLGATQVSTLERTSRPLPPRLRTAVTSNILAPISNRFRGRRGSFKHWPIYIVVAAISLSLTVYPLTVHNALTGIHPPYSGFDDGVYFAVAVRLVHGSVPYRDFVFIQPPGIAVLMAPVALLSRVFGTDWGFAVARIVTALVASCSSVLAAYVLRSRGRLAMAVGGIALALFPMTAAASAQDELEIYVVLFALIGAAIIFRHPQLTTRRLFVGSMVLGFSANIKLFGAPFAVALVLCMLPNWRNVRTATIGAFLGFSVPFAPFFFAAPQAAFNQVFLDPYRFGVLQHTAVPIATKLAFIFGLPVVLPGASVQLIDLFFIALIAWTITICVAHLRRLTRFEMWVIIALVMVLAELFLSREFYDHYAYLSAPLVALLLGLLLSRTSESLASLGRRVSLGRYLPLALMVGVAGVLGAFAATSISSVVGYEFDYVNGSMNPGHQFDSLIRGGSCVVTDQATVLLVIDRFSSQDASCPQVIDSYGMYVTYADGMSPTEANVKVPIGFRLRWLAYFREAKVIALSDSYTWIPLDKHLDRYLSAHFHSVANSTTVQILVRDR